MCRQGWNESLVKLEDYLAKGRAASKRSST